MVASEAWPSVCCTTCTGAPRSMACDAWACRHQCIENGGGDPARRAACLTLECMAFTDNALRFHAALANPASATATRSITSPHSPLRV